MNNNKGATMEELREVFNERDTAFAAGTMKIFELIHTTLVCVTEFLNESDPVCAAGNISWEDANLMEDLVVIIGMVDYAPGTAIEADGNLVTITEDNLEYFQRVVHMSLPYDLVKTSNEVEITAFLRTINENVGEEFTDAVSPPTTSDTDFDLSKLTEEQRKSLMMHNAKGKS